MKFFIYLLIISALSIDLILTTEELLTALIISNVGASAPPCSFIYPSYHINMTKWSNGLNNLTDVGIIEDYLKGQHLKTRYTQLFRAHNVRPKFSCSGDYKSKLSTLVTSKGFSDENITNRLADVKNAVVEHLDPHVIVRPDLNLDSFDKCFSIIRSLALSCTQNRGYNASISDKSELLNVMQNNTGFSLWNSFQTASIINTLMADNYHGNPLPSWVNGNMLSEMIYIYLQAVPGVCNCNVDWYKKVLGPLSNDIVAKLKKHSKSTNRTHKLYVYTTLGYTFAALFDILNVTQRYVNPSSELILELWKDDLNNLDIKLYYKDGVYGDYEFLGSQRYTPFKNLLITYRTGHNLIDREECIENPLKYNHPQAINC